MKITKNKNNEGQLKILDNGVYDLNGNRYRLIAPIKFEKYFPFIRSKFEEVADYFKYFGFDSHGLIFTIKLRGRIPDQFKNIRKGIGVFLVNENNQIEFLVYQKNKKISKKEQHIIDVLLNDLNKNLPAEKCVL